jgi:peptide/nickel transport system substrate-binding protein
MDARGLLLASLLAAAACAPRPAPSVTIVISKDIVGIDPNRELEVVTDSVLFNVYEPLVAHDEGLRVRTVLADSWEHPRAEQWRFHLRRGATFHDGTPVTAAEVRDALLALRRDPRSEAASFLTAVEDVRAEGDATLDLWTREPRALLASLPTLYVAKPNAKGNDPALVGTGPFRLATWEPGRRVVLERWEQYWGGRPALQRAVYVPEPDPARRLARVRGGEADLAYEIPPDMAQGALPGGRFVRTAGLTTYYISLDVRPGAHNPLADVRVRRALHLAIDREALVQGPLRGAGRPAAQPAPPVVFGHNPALPVPRPDLAEARRLLAAAGRAGGFATQLDFPSVRAAVAQHLQESLAAIGVRLRLNPLTVDQVYERAREGAAPMSFVGWSFTTGEASEFYEFNLRTSAPPRGLGNYGGYSSARLDAIADGNAAVMDARDRRRMLEEAALIVVTDLPVLSLYVADSIYAVRDGLTFTPRVDGEIRLLDVRVMPPR